MAAAVRSPSLRPFWWGTALLLDAVLLALLPYVGWIALVIGGAFVVVWLVREPHRALAFAAMGQAFVATAGYLAGIDPGVVLAEQLVVLIPLGLWLWQRVWEWPRPRRGNRIRAGRATKRVLGWTILLALALGIGVAWTPSPSYGRSKFILFSIRNALFLFAAWKLLQPESTDVSIGQRGVAFLRFLLGLGITLAVISLLNLWVGYWDTGNRLSVMDLNPIWFARYLGVGILAVISLRALKELSAPAAVMALFVLIPPFYLAGSRGPLLAILTAGCFFLLSGRSWNTPFRRSILIAVPILSVAVVAVIVAQGTLHDWSPFGSHSASNVAREMMLQTALQWISQPGWFGLGTGAFSNLVGVGDMRFYPHNVFVEIWLENGVLGIVALIGFCTAAGQVWLGTRREDVLDGRTERGLIRFAATWFVFSLVNAQFSGDLPANEHLFLAAGALLAWSRSNEAGSRLKSPPPQLTQSA